MARKLFALSFFLLVSTNLSKANAELELLRKLTDISGLKLVNNHASNFAERKISEIKFMLSRIGLETSDADQNRIIEYTNNQDFAALSQCFSALFTKTLTDGPLTPHDVVNNKPLAIAVSGILSTFLKNLNTDLKNDTQECKNIFAKHIIIASELLAHIDALRSKETKKILDEKELELRKQLADLHAKKADPEQKNK